jgi:ABC-type transport system involved in multi-copper enzyme maturation permease subunit
VSDHTPPAPVKVRPTRRRVRTPLVGPLFSWELVRLARRGQDARARTILALVLLLTQFGFTVVWFRTTDLRELFFGTQQVLDIQESAQFAEQFALSLLLAQMAVMVLIAPAYAAGSIAEEKERKTFANLLTSELSNREIVVGKFLGRVTFLLGVMLAGLPVLALTGLIGGIDPLFLVLSYALTGTTVFLLAAVAMTAAVYAGTFRGAMFRAYGLTALYVLFGCGLHPMLSPFAVLVMFYTMRAEMGGGEFILGGLYAAFQLLFAFLALWMAVRRVRPVRLKEPPLSPRLRDKQRRPKKKLDEAENIELIPEETPPDGPVRTAVAVAKAVPLPARPAARKVPQPDENRDPRRPHRPVYEPPEVANRPPVSDNDPFYWKEKYTLGTRRTADEESIRGVVIVVGAIVVTVIAFISSISLLVALFNPSRGSQAAVAQTLILTGAAGVFAHLLTLGSAACQTVLRERQRQTLDSLLTLPVPRRAILGPKWRVAAGRGWWWGGPGMAAIVLGLLVSELSLAAVPTAVYLPAMAAFAVSLGVWLSIRSGTTARAMMWFMTVAGGLLLVPISVWWGFYEENVLWATGLLSAAALLVGFGAWFLWHRACRDFDEYGRE